MTSSVNKGLRTSPIPQEPTPAIKFNQDEQAFHKHLTLGIEEKLQKNRMIKEVKLIIRQPAEKPSISAWERKQGVSLPSDLKDYYLSTNGFKLTWSLEHAGDNLKIGDMNINQINHLLPLESASRDNSCGSSTGVGTHMNSKTFTDPRKLGNKGKPSSVHTMSGKTISMSKNSSLGGSEDDANNIQIPYSELRLTMEANGQAKSQDPGGLFLMPNDKAFLLDQNQYGSVCLIYPESKCETNQPLIPLSSPSSSSSQAKVVEPSVEIWFLDPSFQWSYLAPTFTHYYRMLLFHLGLPQWQYRFTQYGLSAWAEQMCWLVAPHLLTPPKISKFPSIYHAGGLWSASTDVSSEAATPNSTLNILSNQIFRRKKKEKDKSDNN